MLGFISRKLWGDPGNHQHGSRKKWGKNKNLKAVHLFTHLEKTGEYQPKCVLKCVCMLKMDTILHSWLRYRLSRERGECVKQSVCSWDLDRDTQLKQRCMHVCVCVAVRKRDRTVCYRLFHSFEVSLCFQSSAYSFI